MRYNLGNYRYDNGKVYVKWWWFIYRVIDEGPMSYMDGVKMVNSLAGVEE